MSSTQNFVDTNKEPPVSEGTQTSNTTFMEVNQSTLMENSAIENKSMTIDEIVTIDKNSTTPLVNETMNESLNENDNLMEEISLHEELDALSPLMIDNHTIIEHHEMLIDEIKEFIPKSTRLMRLSDTKDSISSIDSDLSLSYDRRNSHELNNLPSEISDGNNSSSDENAKDSGCETTNHRLNNENDLLQNEENDSVIPTDPPIEIPDDDLCEKIVEQVEFYFSNENILKDAFLLKHVRRNKEGFVSLKLVSSFKRVRQLTKDWRVVGVAVQRKSQKIELNDLKTKIRRLEALPSYDETMPSRTVVATDLPCEKITIEKISDLFSKCGEIALVRILRPGGAIPADVRQFINKYPDLQQKECALVEFVESNSARLALSIEGMKIYEMVAPKKKTGKKASVTKMIDNFKYNESDLERSRGGGIINTNQNNDYKYRIKRNNSGHFIKPIEQHLCLQQQRKLSFNNENFDHFHRRSSNCSDVSRKFSSCSEGYSSCSEMSRRPSSCSEMSSRRTSNCSDSPSSRRSSCSDFCPCSRRMSQCSDAYRRISQCSEHNRKYSNGLPPHHNINNNNNMNNIMNDRRLSNCSDINRRLSMDNHFERKISNCSINEQQPMRKFSNNFELIRKISADQQYYNRKLSTNSGYDSGYDRKLSIDSDYDRKLSIGSDYSGAPRSRSGSLFNPIESVVRTPIGPDGSKGFASRTRKLGQTVPPV